MFSYKHDCSKCHEWTTRGATKKLGSKKCVPNLKYIAKLENPSTQFIKFHKELRGNLQPDIKRGQHCTVLLLDNLMYTEWATVQCDYNMLDSVICSRSVHKSVNPDVSVERSLYDCNDNQLLINGFCYKFKRFVSTFGNDIYAVNDKQLLMDILLYVDTAISMTLNLKILFRCDQNSNFCILRRSYSEYDGLKWNIEPHRPTPKKNDIGITVYRYGLLNSLKNENLILLFTCSDNQVIDLCSICLRCF